VFVGLSMLEFRPIACIGDPATMLGACSDKET
jgi:hypothetical protein